MLGHTAIGGSRLTFRQPLKPCKSAEGSWTINMQHVTCRCPSAGDGISSKTWWPKGGCTAHSVSILALPLQTGTKGLMHALTNPDGSRQEGHWQLSYVGGDDIGPGGKKEGITLLVDYRQAVDLYKKSNCD